MNALCRASQYCTLPLPPENGFPSSHISVGMNTCSGTVSHCQRCLSAAGNCNISAPPAVFLPGRHSRRVVEQPEAASANFIVASYCVSCDGFPIGKPS